MCHNLLMTDGAIMSHAKFFEGGGVHDLLKINHTTFLRCHMSIGYLEPLVYNRFAAILE